MTPAIASPALTTAASRAARNWSANLLALSAAQPALVDRLQSLAVPGEWVLARDGALTLIDPAGRWLGDCSVPYRAAAAMLKTLDPRGTVACYLAPDHAAPIRAAFDLLTPQQAVIVLQPDLHILRSMLSCEDFTGPVQAGRLFFAAGDGWAAELRQIFTAHPGLPTPQQFIKLPILLAEMVDPLIAESQAVFAAVLAERAAAMASLRQQWRATTKSIFRVGLIAGSRFSLWDDAGCALAEALHADPSATLARLDPDAPTTAGPLSVARACQDCDALVIPDAARCDFPGVVPDDLPWITWITRGRIPPAATAGPRDALVLADPAWRDAAVAKGWPANRLAIGGFPPLNGANPSAPPFAGWTILADTLPIVKPKSLANFSSSVVLWESIEQSLLRDPFSLSEDLTGYLLRHAKHAGVEEATLDAKLFIESLLVPVYAQGIARALLHQGIPLRIFGSGWENIADFSRVVAGEIASRDALKSAIASSSRLVHVWPSGGFHPLYTTGLPILRRTQPQLSTFLQQARRGLSETPAAAAPISTSTILSLL